MKHVSLLPNKCGNLHNDVVNQTLETIAIHKIKGPDKIHGKSYQICSSQDRYFTLPIKCNLGLQLRLLLKHREIYPTLFISRFEFLLEICICAKGLGDYYLIPIMLKMGETLIRWRIIFWKQSLKGTRADF